MFHATSLKDLAAALGTGESSISIEGDLANRIIRIKATGPIAWVSAFGMIGIGVTLAVRAPISPAAGPALATAALVSSGAAAGILGIGAAKAAITIAVVGGVGVLERLRSEYKLRVQSDGTVLLTKD